MSIWSSAPASCTRCRDLLSEVAAGSGQRMEVSLDRKDGSRSTRSSGASKASIPLRDPHDAADALSGLRADSDRLRQVLHLLHRARACAVRSKAGRRSTSWPKPASWPIEGCREITLLGQTVNSYSITATAIAPRGCPICSSALHEIDGIRAAQVRHELSQGHDRRPAAGRARFAQVLALSARAGAKRLATTVLKRMKRGYTVEEYREMHGRIRDD